VAEEEDYQESMYRVTLVSNSQYLDSVSSTEDDLPGIRYPSEVDEAIEEAHF